MSGVSGFLSLHSCKSTIAFPRGSIIPDSTSTSLSSLALRRSYSSRSRSFLALGFGAGGVKLGLVLAGLAFKVGHACRAVRAHRGVEPGRG